MFGSSRRALLARWCGVGSNPQQLRVVVVPPSGRQQPQPLQQFASWFHTTARTCNKTDWDYYEQLAAGTKGTNTNTSSSGTTPTTTSTSQKTSPKPSIYDVHKLPRSSLYPPRPTTVSAPSSPSPPPPPPVVTDKHRSEWDHGDWKRYRQQYGRQSHRPSAATALDEVDDDPEDPRERRRHRRGSSRSRDTNPTIRPAPRDDDDDDDEVEHPRRYSGRDNHQPHSNRTRHSSRSATVVVPLQTDEAGRRFRQSTTPTTAEEEEDASLSSSWYNNRYDRSRMIPRNGEASLGARSRPPSGGAPYFAQYTKPHVKQQQQQQPPQRGRPTMTTNQEARTRSYDQERRQAEELIWKSTPIVDEDGEYYMDDNSSSKDEDEPDSDIDEEDYPEKVTEEEDLAVAEKGPAERKPATAEESMFPPHFMSAYISCHKGLEFFLHRELTELGVAHHMHKSYGAQLLGPITAKDIMNCHLYLGTASNIFLRCGDTFSARALGELRRKVTIMPWANILQLNEQQPQQPPKFKVKVSSAKSRLTHTSAIRDQMLSGIYESLGFMEIAEKLKDHTKPKEEKLYAMGMENKEDDGKDKDDNEQDDNEEDDGADDVVRLSIHFFRDRAQISIDTSATPIHQRAYRLETCKAPLREDLSFAFLLSAGWKPSYFGLDRWDLPQLETEETSPKMKDLPLLTAPPPQYTSFLDPFCGSGTIAIEAAAMAAGLPPGRLRPAPLAGTKLYDPQLWKSLVQEGLQRSAAIDNNIRIYASDRDRGAVKATLSNAQRAGVLGFIETRECAFSNHPWLDDPTSAPDNLLLASNLPWGKRLKMPAHKQLDHKMKSLLPMYQRIATHCNAFTKLEKKADAIFLTDFPEVFRAVDFQAEFDETFASSSGGIKCQGVKVTLNQIKRPGFKAGEKNKGQPPTVDNKEDKTPSGLSAKNDEEEKKTMLVS